MATQNREDLAQKLDRSSGATLYSVPLASMEPRKIQLPVGSILQGSFLSASGDGTPCGLGVFSPPSTRRVHIRAGPPPMDAAPEIRASDVMPTAPLSPPAGDTQGEPSPTRKSRNKNRVSLPENTLSWKAEQAEVRPCPPSLEEEEEPLSPTSPPISPSFAQSRTGALVAYPPGLMPPPNTPSHGSVLHSDGTCRPCAWFWKPGSCKNGIECGHCHLCPEGEIKNRKKCKQTIMRLGLATPKPGQPGADVDFVLSPQAGSSRNQFYPHESPKTLSHFSDQESTAMGSDPEVPGGSDSELADSHGRLILPTGFDCPPGLEWRTQGNASLSARGSHPWSKGGKEDSKGDSKWSTSKKDDMSWLGLVSPKAPRQGAAGRRGYA